MGNSIGLLELKSIPIGLQTADEMLKSANIKLLVATPTCPGKYIIIVSGQVGAIESAMKVGVKAAGTFLICNHIINNVHSSLPSALLATAAPTINGAVGVIETMSALTAVQAGDIAVKAANVSLIEIRIARGLGGKGYLIFAGEISSVKNAISACENQLMETGDITSSCTIASMHKDLLEKLM